jgi:uracil-DNA glycosylase
MEGPMDKFVRKRKTDEDEAKDQNTNQETKKEEKSPLKVKKNIETKDEKMTDIIKEVPKKTVDDPNAKFYTTYESFIDKLETWKLPLKSFIDPPNNSQMKSIYTFVKKEYENKTIFPPKNLIFNAFSKTPWNKVKVVIIGQDPYPNPGDAMGLSFSVPRNQRIPGSLINIYKCLEKDKKLKFVKPKHGDLSSWAEQGVFLINATLTVECKKANSHQKNSGWSKFTDYVIKQISLQKKNIVFLLWGNFAIAKSSLIDSKKHLIIKNIHPSPLAQSKGDFTKSEQFSQANEYLEKAELEPINWEIK